MLKAYIIILDAYRLCSGVWEEDGLINMGSIIYGRSTYSLTGCVPGKLRVLKTPKYILTN